MVKKRNSQQQLQQSIDSSILNIRGERVILDTDLAQIYGVRVSRLNEQVKRNLDRFPGDFLLRVSSEEWDSVQRLRSQNAILKKERGKHRKYLPLAFTEHGAIMAANVLNSKRAVQMSVFVVRAFIKMRGLLTDNKQLARKLAELEKELKQRLDIHETAIAGVLQRIMDIIDPPALPEPKKRPKGLALRNADDTCNRLTGRTYHSAVSI